MQYIFIVPRPIHYNIRVAYFAVSLLSHCVDTKQNIRDELDLSVTLLQYVFAHYTFLNRAPAASIKVYAEQ